MVPIFQAAISIQFDLLKSNLNESGMKLTQQQIIINYVFQTKSFIKASQFPATGAPTAIFLRQSYHFIHTIQSAFIVFIHGLFRK